MALLAASFAFFSSLSDKRTPPHKAVPTEKTETVAEEQLAERSQDLQPLERKEAAIIANRRPVQVDRLSTHNSRVPEPAPQPKDGQTALVKIDEAELSKSVEELEPPGTDQVVDDQLRSTITELKRVRESFIKIGRQGEKLVDGAGHWACVKDLTTGLVWEVKLAEGGLHNKNNLYSWYEPHEKSEVAGVADGGRCEGDTDCDTHSFVQALNAEKYCGYTDWRMPTRDEMQTIVVVGNGGVAATINRDYFPHGLASWYWTATTNENHTEYAWYLLFRNGITLSDLKSRPKHLRLVRSDSLAR